MKSKFIKTLDKETSDKLQKIGFEKISDDCGTYVFINNDKLTFSDEDKINVSKITYSDIFCI